MTMKLLLKHTWRLVTNKWFWIGKLAIMVIVLFFANKNLRQEKARLNSNVSALNQEVGTTSMKLMLKEKEMKEYYEEDLKVLRDSLAVKPKEVIRYQYIKTIREVHDTVAIHDTIIQGIPYFESNYKDKCTEATFRWKDGKSTGVFEVDVKNKMYIVDHWQRKYLWGVKVLPKWGRKEVFVDVINECSGDSIIQNYRIESVK